jgi:hypothetical protein
MTALEVISNSFIVEVTFGLGCYATIGREAITKHDGPFLNIIICKSIAFHLSALYLEHVYTFIHRLLPYLSSLLPAGPNYKFLHLLSVILYAQTSLENRPLKRIASHPRRLARP